MDPRRDRARGALLGLAVGDALGTTLEFAMRDSLPTHTEMTGGGPYGLEPGLWTDDTSLALALGDSLVACRGFDATDLIDRFVAWWRRGDYSSTGVGFGIGETTACALRRFEASRDPFAGSTLESEAGNGSLMRLAPVALLALDDAARADDVARAQSRVTHGASQAVEACAFLVQILREAVLGAPDPLRRRPWSGHPAIAAIAAGRMAEQGARRDTLVRLCRRHARGRALVGGRDRHVRGGTRAGGEPRRRRGYDRRGHRPDRRRASRRRRDPGPLARPARVARCDRRSGRCVAGGASKWCLTRLARGRKRPRSRQRACNHFRFLAMHPASNAQGRSRAFNGLHRFRVHKCASRDAPARRRSDQRKASI